MISHRIPLLLPFLFALGCDGALAVNLPEPLEPRTIALNDRFDPSRNGTVGGVVKWTDAVPTFEPLKVVRFRVGAPSSVDSVPHPNAPLVSKSGGLQSAVVYLKGIDPRRSKPMDAAIVGVELDALGLSMVRDGQRRRATWVPVGSELRVANRLEAIGGIRARGTEFFTHLFPDRDDSVVRKVTRPGRTTFTSASGQYWAVADLFASDHPYIANADESGRFRFDGVPDGEYELIAWHPNWHIAGHELDPETGVITRQTYAAPVEIRTAVRVVAGATLDVKLAFATADFLRR